MDLYGGVMSDYDSIFNDDDDRGEDDLTSSISEGLSGVFVSLQKGILRDEVLEQISQDLAKRIVSECSSSIQASFTESVRCAVAGQLKDKAADFCDQAFKEVLADKIVNLKENSWSQKRIAIGDMVKAEFEKILDTLKTEKGVKKLVEEAVKSFMAKEIDEMVKASIVDLKREVSEELTKETMKGVIRAVCTQVGADKKLLALLT